jgi:hypothetical protein
MIMNLLQGLECWTRALVIINSISEGINFLLIVIVNTLEIIIIVL